MCNNNGTCRKMFAGTMCPSYRATKDEKHVTRGRANTLRLAISGQLGPDAFTSPEMKETLDLCVSCKGCKRDCPTGVDMARMKIEFLHHYHKRHGLPAKEWLIANLPRYAPYAARLAPLMNLRDRLPVLARLTEKYLGFSARRTLPKWRKPWRQGGAAAAPSDVVGDGRDVILFGDTFNRYYERENLEAAERVLVAVGLPRAPGRAAGRRTAALLRPHLPVGRPGRRRAQGGAAHVDTLAPYVAKGARVLGLEPSCIFTFRDEMTAILPKDEVAAVSRAALMFEEALAADLAKGSVACRRGTRADASRMCTATATRRPSPRWARSRRCCAPFPACR